MKRGKGKMERFGGDDSESTEEMAYSDYANSQGSPSQLRNCS